MIPLTECLISYGLHDFLDIKKSSILMVNPRNRLSHLKTSVLEHCNDDNI